MLSAASLGVRVYDLHADYYAPMNSSVHEEAYAALIDQLLTDLIALRSPAEAPRFARLGANLIRDRERRVTQFYRHEFIDLFKNAMITAMHLETDRLQQRLRDVQSQADVATVELTAQMDAARAVGDRDAEHRLWQEREQVQQDVDGNMQVVNDELAAIGPRLEAFQLLTSEVGVTLS